MDKDKDLKKKIRAGFEKPEKPFDEWAAENGISLLPADDPERARSSGSPAKRPHVRSGAGAAVAVRRGALVAALLLVIAAVIVSVIVLNMPASDKQPILYGYNDVEIEYITIDEVKAVPGIYLFDMSGVVQTESVTKELLKNDNSVVLSYVLTNNLLSAANGEAMDAFYVTYRVRVYKNYEFMHYAYYDDLTHNATVNGHDVSYEPYGLQSSTAYAEFTAGDYEYFIEARGFEGVTELTEDNFLNLLDKILL